MKFSAQEEFGLRCLMAIAREPDNENLTIPEIAKREGLTQPHAAKLLATLRRSGFITSTRGQSGGYRLAKPASQIVIGSLLSELGGKLVEGEFCVRFSGVHDECLHRGHCTLRPLWNKIQSAVDSVVYDVTLQDLIDGRLDAPRIAAKKVGRPAKPKGAAV